VYKALSSTLSRLTDTGQDARQDGVEHTRQDGVEHTRQDARQDGVEHTRQDGVEDTRQDARQAASTPVHQPGVLRTLIEWDYELVSKSMTRTYRTLIRVDK
jgi:hypothetical protein